MASGWSASAFAVGIGRVDLAIQRRDRPEAAVVTATTQRVSDDNGVVDHHVAQVANQDGVETRDVVDLDEATSSATS
jgi:hypothetical protein